jgi:hypothetical protein
MVIRGGNHEIHRKSRPFAVVQVTPNGPAYLDGTIRTGDRIITVNGQDIRSGLFLYRCNLFAKSVYCVVKMVMHDRVKLWGESKTAERQRERESLCVCERQSVAGNERWRG